MRKFEMKRILMMLWLAIMCICLISCGEPYNRDEEKKKIDNKTYTIGDTVELQNQNFTVNRVRILEEDKDGYKKPEDGKEFLLVSCTIENTSDEDICISSMLLFKIFDKEGVECKQEIFINSEGNLDVTVLPGKKIKGEYVVQAPKGAKDLELQYRSNAIGGESVVVKLN